MEGWVWVWVWGWVWGWGWKALPVRALGAERGELLLRHRQAHLELRRLLARRARVLRRGALRHTELVGQARVGLREHAERRGAVRLEPVPHLRGDTGRYREMQGDAGRCREIQKAQCVSSASRTWEEMQGDTGRYREIQGDTGRYRETQGDTGR